jgi:hypothetical protein
MCSNDLESKSLEGFSSEPRQSSIGVLKTDGKIEYQSFDSIDIGTCIE